MIKILFYLPFIFLLSACDNNVKHTDNDHYLIMCINGKEFIRGVNQLSINLDFNGKPIPCQKQ